MALKLPDIRTAGDLGDEYRNFVRSIRAENLSDNTVYAYAGALESLARFLAAYGYPTDLEAIKKSHIEEWLNILRAQGYRDATINQRFRGAQRFFNWYAGEVDDDSTYRSPMAKMKQPRMEKRLIEVLSETQMESVLRAASGKTFEGRRDEALVRTFQSSGARRAEVANLTLDDVNLDGGYIRVIGKGDKERIAPIDDLTVDALTTYIRSRRKHPHAEEAWLWLGRKGRLTDSGIAQTIRDIGLRAGIPDLHPHRFRHTWNHELDRAGVPLHHRMQAAGWTTDKMPRYYGASMAGERALDAIHAAMRQGRKR